MAFGKGLVTVGINTGSSGGARVWGGVDPFALSMDRHDRRLIFFFIYIKKKKKKIFF